MKKLLISEAVAILGILAITVAICLIAPETPDRKQILNVSLVTLFFTLLTLSFIGNLYPANSAIFLPGIIIVAVALVTSFHVLVRPLVSIGLSTSFIPTIVVAGIVAFAIFKSFDRVFADFSLKIQKNKTVFALLSFIAMGWTSFGVLYYLPRLV